MKIYLIILVFSKLTNAGILSVDCTFDPVEKKYVSICPTSQVNTCEVSSSDSVFNELKRVFREKLDKEFSEDAIQAAQKSEASDFQDSDRQNNTPDNLEDSVRWELKIDISKNYDIDELLHKIISEMKKVDPSYPEADSLETELFSKSFLYDKLKFIIIPNFGYEVVPLAVIFIGFLVYFKIVPMKLVLFVFVCTSYIQTYHEQIEKFENKQFNSFANQNHNKQKSMFSWWSRNNEEDALSNQSLRPLTVFFIMISETFCEPMIIFSKTLKGVVIAGFSDLNLFLWPIMLIVFTVAGLFVMYGLLFMFGLELNFKLLGGFLASCNIKKSESKSVVDKKDESDQYEKLIKSLPTKEDLELLCQKMEVMNLKVLEQNKQLQITDKNMTEKIDVIDDYEKESKQISAEKSTVIKKPVKVETISHIGNGDFAITKKNCEICKTDDNTE